ncbi:MAG: RNA-binding protein [Candidatus Poseidoniales archaeon]|nr:MAG: RNA-binding protein [Candidatus Poseidoniales archaeon]
MYPHLVYDEICHATLPSLRRPSPLISKDWQKPHFSNSDKIYYFVVFRRSSVSEKKLRRRTPVRYKQVKHIIKEVSEMIGKDIQISDKFLEKGNFDDKDILLVDRKILAFQVEIKNGKLWFPTIRGILYWLPEIKWAAVDHGAIPFLLNGADCMGAGIHLTDISIKSGDLIWIKDEEHGKPLAIGIAIVDGEEMVEMKKGKAVETIHWIGDELWELET